MAVTSTSRRVHLALAALASVLVVIPAILRAEAQQQNGRGVGIKEVKELPAKAKRYGLVIGVDQYQDTQISRLEGATNDAKLLADALTRYANFPSDQVILLASDQPPERQPTRGNILQYLSNLHGVVPEDGLLLVSFAGHGIERGGRGFLCPSDARLGSMTLLEATAIPIDTVREWLREMGVKQVLIILDACRNDPSGRGDEQNRMTDSFAQQFNFDVRNQEVTAFATLYATDVGHVAYEYKEKKQGYFTWGLIEGLKGGAANEKGEVTLGGLVRYLQEQVPKRIRLDLGAEKLQRPYAIVGGYKADELIVSVAVRAASSTDLASLELEFWNSVKTSSDIDDFKAYLDKYPSGTFATLAKNKIKSLEPAAKPNSGGDDRSANPPAVTNPIAPQPTSAATDSQKDVNGQSWTDNQGSSISPIRTLHRRQENDGLQRYTENINGVSIDMVRVPAGKFLMGSPSNEEGRSDDESPQHEVNVSSFYMGMYEVTQSQWRAVAQLPKVKLNLDPTPSHFKGDDYPVESVSWDEAVEFCARLSRATGKNYRLPTEAEWEYAARAMTTGLFAGNLDAMAWYDLNSGDVTHPVGTREPNGFGLFDMHGNVWEWCQDWYLENYYSQSPRTNPAGPSMGLGRVNRGGSFHRTARYSRSAQRAWNAQTARGENNGFRLAMSYN